MSVIFSTAPRPFIPLDKCEAQAIGGGDNGLCLWFVDGINIPHLLNLRRVCFNKVSRFGLQDLIPQIVILQTHK